MTARKVRYYKAVRPDGTDFHTGKVNYLTGGTVQHPRIKGTATTRGLGRDASNYLSVSTVLGDFPGASWPWRILEVEPVGELWEPGDTYPNKRACLSLRVVRELRPWAGFGPQGKHVDALVKRAKNLTYDDAKKLAAARAAAGHAAWAAARHAAWDAARAAARDAARDAAGLVVRDLIGQHGFTQTHYDLLTGPWRKVIGPIHPDDEVLS